MLAGTWPYPMLLLRFFLASSSFLSWCSVPRSGFIVVAVAAVAAVVLPTVAALLRVVAGMLPDAMSNMRPVVALEVGSMGDSPT